MVFEKRSSRRKVFANVRVFTDNTMEAQNFNIKKYTYQIHFLTKQKNARGTFFCNSCIEKYTAKTKIYKF